MARMRVAFGILKAVFRGVNSAVRYVRRRSMKDEQQPRLELDFIHPPSWGAERLALGISNRGGGTARNCRYCRVQEFSMAGPSGHSPSFSTRRWYISERLTIPPAAQKRASARLTVSACPQAILSDLVDPGGDEGFCVDAIVCEDTAGALYRFRCGVRGSDPPDRWSAGALDRIRGISAPGWVTGTSTADQVEQVRWSDVR